MASAGDSEVRCEENGALFDEDSRTRTAVGIEDGMRDVAYYDEEEGAWQLG